MQRWLTEIEAGIAAADVAAKQARERALDPTVIDTAARTAMQDSEFLGQRLRAALPRLQVRLDEVRAQEYLAAWREEFKEVEARRDTLAAELKEIYPTIEAKLADIFQRIAECDKEVSRINGSAPSGEPLRLREVELAARDLEHFTRAAASIAHELKLPRLGGAEQAGVAAAAPVRPGFVRACAVQPSLLGGLGAGDGRRRPYPAGAAGARRCGGAETWQWSSALGPPATHFRRWSLTGHFAVTD